MAKQSFTTGQVLLASQLTSLQQTALGGGAASAKVASYTLVAADAGTAISMTNASATTITVNTGLFSAGDTVLLQNLGAGVCTVTAGTATVNTAGSLALAQYEAGVLYFVSASAAVLFDYTQTAAASSSWSQSATGSLTGSSITVSNLSGKQYYVLFEGISNTAAEYTEIRFNGVTSNSYLRADSDTPVSSLYSVGAGTFTAASSPSYGFHVDMADTSMVCKPVQNMTPKSTNGSVSGWFKSTSAITSITFFSSPGSFDAGTYYVWSFA